MLQLVFEDVTILICECPDFAWRCGVHHLTPPPGGALPRLRTMVPVSKLQQWRFFHRIHPVRLFCFSTSQHCFSLTLLQQQPPTTSQPAVFFSYTTSAAVSSTSTANRVNAAGFRGSGRRCRGWSMNTGYSRPAHSLPLSEPLLWEC